MLTELPDRPAKGIQGHILWDPICHRYFFRVYAEEGGFKDYQILAEDIKVEILSSNLSLMADGYLGFTPRDHAEAIAHKLAEPIQVGDIVEYRNSAGGLHWGVVFEKTDEYIVISSSPWGDRFSVGRDHWKALRKRVDTLHRPVGSQLSAEEEAEFDRLLKEFRKQTPDRRTNAPEV